MRLVVGNLDAESDLARELEAASGRPPRPRRALRRVALATASALATLLRAFAREGDRLWLPAPVDPSRLPAVPGLPRPELLSGPLGKGLLRPEPPKREGSEVVGECAPGPRLLVWAETAAVAALRSPPGEDPGGEVEELGELPLHERLWGLAPAPPPVVAAVNHRAFALEVARGLGLALPGARSVGSMAELEAHLAAGGAAAGAGGGWVVKAPLSAAGRDRHLGRGATVAEPERRRLEGLFARHGELLFEPWMERTEDFGVAALLDRERASVVGFHRLLVDRHGGFAGIELPVAFHGFEASLTGFSEAERELWRCAVEGVAAALRRRGYKGPFGLDGWRFRTAEGALGLHPLGEINARLTFGLVARVLVDRVAAALGWAPEGWVRLSVGRQAPGPGSVVLLTPGDDGSPGAWLELVAAHGPTAPLGA